MPAIEKKSHGARYKLVASNPSRFSNGRVHVAVRHRAHGKGKHGGWVLDCRPGEARHTTSCHTTCTTC